MSVNSINKNQTSDLLVLSKIIIAASDAAAPTSNDTAKLIANHLGLVNSKKSIT
jgi:hypothetical protein